MSISLGSTTIGSVYLGSTKIGSAYFGSVKVYPSAPVDPYNPLNLPSYTIRMKFTDGFTPTTSYGTLTQVSASPNVWDFTYSDANWSSMIYTKISSSACTNLIEILGANSTGVTNMSGLFNTCSSLTSVALFDMSSVTAIVDTFHGCSALTSIPQFNTSSVTNFSQAFYGCSALTSCPELDTSASTNMSATWYNCSSLTTLPALDFSSATNMLSMCEGCSSLRAIPSFTVSNALTTTTSAFRDCANVESGSYSMYLSLSALNSVLSYSNTFTNCGYNTVTGAAELDQIPRSWGGNGS